MKSSSTKKYQNILDHYKLLGLNVQPVKGNTQFGDSMVAIMYDGVQYAINSYGRDYKLAINKYHQSIKRHHKLIKKIFDYIISKKNFGDLWALCGGGAQLQIFYGNKSGYLGTLYLDMENENYKKHTPDTSFTFTVNGALNDQYFEDFEEKIPDVKFLSHHVLYDSPQIKTIQFDIKKFRLLLTRWYARKYKQPLKCRVTKYYDQPAIKIQCDDHQYNSDGYVINSWNRDSYGDDGVCLALSEYLQSQGYTFSWYDNPGNTWFDGIMLYVDSEYIENE